MVSFKLGGGLSKKIMAMLVPQNFREDIAIKAGSLSFTGSFKPTVLFSQVSGGHIYSVSNFTHTYTATEKCTIIASAMGVVSQHNFGGFSATIFLKKNDVVLKQAGMSTASGTSKGVNLVQEISVVPGDRVTALLTANAGIGSALGGLSIVLAF